MVNRWQSPRRRSRWQPDRRTGRCVLPQRRHGRRSDMPRRAWGTGANPGRVRAGAGDRRSGAPAVARRKHLPVAARAPVRRSLHDRWRLAWLDRHRLGQEVDQVGSRAGARADAGLGGVPGHVECPSLRRCESLPATSESDTLNNSCGERRRGLGARPDSGARNRRVGAESAMAAAWQRCAGWFRHPSTGTGEVRRLLESPGAGVAAFADPRGVVVALGEVVLGVARRVGERDGTTIGGRR